MGLSFLLFSGLTLSKVGTDTNSVMGDSIGHMSRGCGWTGGVAMSGILGMLSERGWRMAKTWPCPIAFRFNIRKNKSIWTYLQIKLLCRNFSPRIIPLSIISLTQTKKGCKKWEIITTRQRDHSRTLFIYRFCSLIKTIVFEFAKELKIKKKEFWKRFWSG